MAAVNGRTPSSFGQAFTPMTVSGGPSAPTGQPVMIRMQGVPTMPGYRDRVPKWNFRLALKMIINKILRKEDAHWLQNVVER